MSEHNPKPSKGREEQLADGILERTDGEDYNPNPDDVVEAQRARYDARNERLRQTIEDAMEPIEAMQERVIEEAKQAATKPEHQAMIPHQEEHHLTDPPANHAGKHTRPKIPPMFQDGSATPSTPRSIDDLNDPNGSRVPLQGGSTRKDQ